MTGLHPKFISTLEMVRCCVNVTFDQSVMVSAISSTHNSSSSSALGSKSCVRKLSVVQCSDVMITDVSAVRIWFWNWLCVCVRSLVFRWELRSPVRRERRRTWWRKHRKKPSMMLFHTLYRIVTFITLIWFSWKTGFVFCRKDEDPEQKIEFKTRLGQCGWVGRLGLNLQKPHFFIFKDVSVLWNSDTSTISRGL